jgi:hypothetical protein
LQHGAIIIIIIEMAIFIHIGAWSAKGSGERECVKTTVRQQANFTLEKKRSSV